MPTIYLKLVPEGIQIRAYLDAEDVSMGEYLNLIVSPEESFGGFSYNELHMIALTRGKMDADELRV